MSRSMIQEDIYNQTDFNIRLSTIRSIINKSNKINYITVSYHFQNLQILQSLQIDLSLTHQINLTVSLRLIVYKGT